MYKHHSPPVHQLQIDALGNRQRAVYLNAKFAHRALQLGMAENELDGPQIAGLAADQRRLGPAQ
jgi:hypothetical protein